MALLKRDIPASFDAIVSDMERSATGRDALNRYLKVLGLRALIHEIGPYAVEDAIAVAFEHDERHARRIRTMIAEVAAEVGIPYEPELPKRPGRLRRRPDPADRFMLGAPCTDPEHVNNLGSTLRFARDGRCIECARNPARTATAVGGVSDGPEEARVLKHFQFIND